jgi:hypothetical protein
VYTVWVGLRKSIHSLDVDPMPGAWRDLEFILGEILATLTALTAID